VNLFEIAGALFDLEVQYVLVKPPAFKDGLID
jgi:hypothetical protein